MTALPNLGSNIKVIDRTTTVSSVLRVKPISEIVLHDTAGSTSNPDRNTTNVADMTIRQYGTVDYLTQGNSAGTSIHYIVGPEATGAPVFVCVPTNRVAYHAVGNKKGFDGPYGFHSMDNEISIGIEVWGVPGEKKGPNQRRSVLALVTYLAKLYGIKPENIVSHKSIQSDRSDGEAFLQAAREAVRSGVTIEVPELNINPENKNLGDGVRAMLTKLQHQALTNEQYAQWQGSDGQFSLTWAKDNSGGIYVYMAVQNPDGTWPIQVFRKEI